MFSSDARKLRGPSAILGGPHSAFALGPFSGRELRHFGPCHRSRATVCGICDEYTTRAGAFLLPQASESREARRGRPRATKRALCARLQEAEARGSAARRSPPTGPPKANPKAKAVSGGLSAPPFWISLSQKQIFCYSAAPPHGAMAGPEGRPSPTRVKLGGSVQTINGQINSVRTPPWPNR